MSVKQPPREYILVHGAWHGAWCWERIVPRLTALGHRVHAPELPGPDQDGNGGRVTLKHYVDVLADTVARCAQKPIVVGHSMGGMVITQLGEQLWDRILALVYLCAFLPRDGESLAELASLDADSLVSKHRVIDEARGVLTMPAEASREAFYGLCSAADAERASARLRPQPLPPTAAKVRTSTQRFGRIPRTYIECRRDRAMTLRMQRIMHSNTPCAQLLAIDSDHSPFLSAPDELADRLNRVETTGF
jgi:pimeloyl-ACP methyl ester carboxylesterase